MKVSLVCPRACPNNESIKVEVREKRADGTLVIEPVSCPECQGTLVADHEGTVMMVEAQ